MRYALYCHRIFDRYGQEVISLAILADDDPDWRPNRFEYSRWDFRTSIEFPIVKLLDYAAEYQELEANPNPFAVVVLAHLKALETRRLTAERRAWKSGWSRGCTSGGSTRRTCGSDFGSSIGSWSCRSRWKGASGMRLPHFSRRT